MLNKKQIRMLELLDKQVRSCNKCVLRSNGFLLPYWNHYSRYLIINESPSSNEIINNTHLNGGYGRILIDELSKVGFKGNDFAVINSVQCCSHVKPELIHLHQCEDFLRKYIKVLNPEKILCLGNYAKYIFSGKIYGVLKERGKFFDGHVGNGIYFPTLITVHPGYCIYNEDGRYLLRQDIGIFKNSNFIKNIDWLLSEDDFKV